MRNQTKTKNSFSSRALNISIQIHLIYLIVNFGTILICQFLDIGALIDPICRTAGFATILTENIPAIDRAVSFLIDNNQIERAEIVSRFYSFSWITSLLAFFLFSTILIGLLIQLTPEKTREIGALHFASRNTHDNKTRNLDTTTRFVTRNWLWIVLVLIVFFFYMAFFGNYDFDDPGIFDNRVYERDRDLFRLPLFLFFAWFLLSILMIVFALRYCMWKARLRLDDAESRAPSQYSQIDDDGKNTQSRAEERPRDEPCWPD